MAEDTILNLMIAHHALLETMFALFRDEAREKSSKTGASLSELTWETRKHFFIEENAIFDYLPLKSMDVLKTINQLKDEHIVMLDNLKNFSATLPEVKNEELESFHNLLESHRTVEEKDLYPRLDKELAMIQKRKIVSRIEQIPISNNLSE